MATKPKKNASYDLKKADRRRNLMIQIGLTAVVVIFAVGLVLYIVTNGSSKPAVGETKAVRVASSDLMTKEGSTEPKAVLSFYEDFLCPVCGRFEQQFGSTVKQLIATGAVAVDYNMVAILDRPSNNNYSSRAGAAAYCVADEDTTPGKDSFVRFHEALYAQQPDESGVSFPSDQQLIETARQAGVVGKVPECINSGRYVAMVGGLAAASKVNSTPTIKINGEDYQPTTPAALVTKIQDIVGPIPGLSTGAPVATPAQPGAAPQAAPTTPALPAAPAPAPVQPAKPTP